VPWCLALFLLVHGTEAMGSMGDGRKMNLKFKKRKKISLLLLLLVPPIALVERYVELKRNSEEK
jgi:hypothetical protein